jgi:diguanylate cyclase (GGDEF)-like protein
MTVAAIRSAPAGDTRCAPLQGQLTAATQAAQDAYRDTTRLIRVLSVLGQPASPERLADNVLAVLSEVFFAEVTALAHRVEGRLVVSGACGLSEDDAAFTQGWPVGAAAADAMTTGVPAARHGELDPLDVPGSAGRLGIHSAAWVPLACQPGTDNVLLVLRCSKDPFSASDLHVLGSVAARLRLAVEERERHAVVERLVQYGHQLAQHVDLESLLDETVVLLWQLTDADAAWLVTVHGDRAQLRAHRGLSRSEVAGWPPVIGPADRLQPAAFAVPRASGGAGALPAGRTGTVLRVPVVREGRLVALLYAIRERPRPYSQDTTETTTIFANYLGVAMDNAALYRRLRRRATHDPLTGLANRALVGQHLDEALSQDESSRVGLLFCDLDGFKAVNDRLGHEAGDALLQQVARRLRRCMRPTDLLARFGGDEFVVVLDGVTGLCQVAEIGARVSRELDEVFLAQGEPVQVSASIGGVLGVPGLATASSMLRDADAAMYVAKERGRGNVEIFDEAASHRSLDRLELRSELPYALDRDQLALCYQPILAMDTGELVGFEALLRWTHPRHGAVPPEVFIPLAEETGAITRIGDWVMAQACQQLARWRRSGQACGLTMSVNLSGAQLRQQRLVAQTVAAISDAGLEPADICLEITEKSYLRDDVTGYAAALQAAGVRFALDDFGTAYSSLSYLRQFPIDCLKIDRSFVGGTPGRDVDVSIVRAVLAIAESMGLSTIAEGVETEQQRAALLGLGCRLGQGYLLSVPLPPAEATDFLRGCPSRPVE